MTSSTWAWAGGSSAASRKDVKITFGCDHAIYTELGYHYPDNCPICRNGQKIGMYVAYACTGCNHSLFYEYGKRRAAWPCNGDGSHTPAEDFAERIS